MFTTPPLRTANSAPMRGACRFPITVGSSFLTGCGALRQPAAFRATRRPTAGIERRRDKLPAKGLLSAPEASPCGSACGDAGCHRSSMPPALGTTDDLDSAPDRGSDVRRPVRLARLAAPPPARRLPLAPCLHDAPLTAAMYAPSESLPYPPTVRAGDAVASREERVRYRRARVARRPRQSGRSRRAPPRRSLAREFSRQPPGSAVGMPPCYMR